MPIVLKSLLSSSVVNNTFLEKSIDDIKKGKMSLYKVSQVETGFVDDVQNYLNEIADTAGQIFEGDANRKVYATNNVIADGDDRKVAIEKFDVQVQTNIDDITTIQNTLTAGEIIIKGYANDAAYESANGAPPYSGLTGIYYNTTDGVIKYYDGVAVEWAEVGSGGGGIGQHEDLGNGDGVTTDFALTFAPLTDESFIVFLNGNKVPLSDYSFINPTITFNTAPAAGQKVDVWMLTDGSPSVVVTPSGTLEVEYHTLSAGEITAKEITLVSTPSAPTKVVLDVIEGSSQHYGVDYSVSGTTLTWNGLGLDGSLIAGDVLRYWYFTA